MFSHLAGFCSPPHGFSSQQQLQLMSQAPSVRPGEATLSLGTDALRGKHGGDRSLAVSPELELIIVASSRSSQGGVSPRHAGSGWLPLMC